MNQYTLDDINPVILQCNYLDLSEYPVPGTHFGIRRVKWFELELITRGSGVIITNGVELAAERGSLFFRTPGMMVDGVLPYESYIVIFDPVRDTARIPEYKDGFYHMASDQDEFEGGVPFVKSVAGLELPNVMKVANTGMYSIIFEKLNSVFLMQGKYNQFFLRSLLMQLLIMAAEELPYICKNQSASRSLRKNTPGIMKVKDYIDRNIQMNFKLEQLSSKADLSPSSFCRLFKRVVGVSPITYINTNKINLAKKLLTKTNMPIKAISLECGFENDTYFFTLFKSKLGISPSNFREKYGVTALFRDVPDRPGF